MGPRGKSGEWGLDHAWDNTKKIQLFLLKKMFFRKKKKNKIKACHGNRIEFFLFAISAFFFGLLFRLIWISFRLDAQRIYTRYRAMCRRLCPQCPLRLLGPPLPLPLRFAFGMTYTPCCRRKWSKITHLVNRIDRRLFHKSAWWEYIWGWINRRVKKINKQ